MKVADGLDKSVYRWVGSIVDASRDQMRTQYGRMNRTDGSENSDKYGADPYEVPVISANAMNP